MRVLLIHAEKFSFKVRERALKNVPEIDEKLREGKADNALVVFTAVEDFDTDSMSYLQKIARDIIDVAKKVNARCIVLYPYAHLSSNLARPDKALHIFDKLREVLEKNSREEGLEFMWAPFGYYKSFEIKCIGHPLAELSRTYSPEEVEGREERVEVPSFYVIITPEGDIYDAREYKFKENERDLEILVRKEVLKEELKGGEEPRYLTYCKKFGIEWEPMSDIGHMRYGPEATIMYDLVEKYSWIVANRLGIPIFRIRGTNMFKLSCRPIAEHAKLFGERMYTLESDKETLVLRYAACFQQFSMVRDWVLSYRNLPFGVLEIADSYRYEQPGETVLCFRVRKFTMPDLHIFTRDLEEAKEICFKVHKIIFEEIRKIGLDYVSLYNVTEDFYNQHLEYLKTLARIEGKPILVRVLKEKKYYWVLNAEYHIIDELERPREIATMQIDIGNAERFGIKYRTAEGEDKHPVIIHTALIGSVERYLYAILQKAALDEKSGKLPRLPTWICPVQVRVIPVSRDFVQYCEKIVDDLIMNNIRADLDDREESVSKKIREAEKSWIPYIVVVGREEVESNVLTVRVRGSKELKKMGLEELVKTIKEELKGYPISDIVLPKRLSERPQYKVVI
ncbi:MAG: threonine--tRNA ligase [Crenarchaeota archaeon]|nr:threonine--tRNA ligase [Thermoproteota archaeon]